MALAGCNWVVTAARREGVSVLLVEQNVRAATEIADRAYVFDDGRVVFCGKAAEFAGTRSACARSPALAPRLGRWMELNNPASLGNFEYFYSVVWFIQMCSSDLSEKGRFLRKARS
jgi:hypothetical protein